MSKAIIISVSPRFCEAIATNKCSIIVRKTSPKFDTPFKCYIYCTRANNSAECLLINKNKQAIFGDYRNACNCDIDGNIDCYLANGYVIGEFTCDRIDEYTYHDTYGYVIPCKDYKKMCLSATTIEDYGKGKTLYGWHISDLKIYDEPRELSEFGQKCTDANEIHCRNCLNNNGEDFCEKMIKPFTRPPQSWGYVEEIIKGE